MRNFNIEEPPEAGWDIPAGRDVNYRISLPARLAALHRPWAPASPHLAS